MKCLKEMGSTVKAIAIVSYMGIYINISYMGPGHKGILLSAHLPLVPHVCISDTGQNWFR